MVTWGTSPQDVVPVSGVVPDPEKEKDEDRKKSMIRSLNYMGLKPNGHAFCSLPTLPCRDPLRSPF